MRFIDLHSHLLPGIDDGSSSIVETVEMLRIAHRRGTRGIVATPHAFQPMFATHSLVALCGAFSRMMEQLQDYSHYSEHSFLKEVDVYLGAENLVSPEFLGALERREVLALNGSRYLLVEFPLSMAFPLAESAVEQILERELVPVLAHVERYEFCHQRPECLEDLKRRGCVIQVNADSIGKGREDENSKLAVSLASQGVLDVIASDGHDASARPPEVQSAFDRLAKELSEEKLNTWMSENPSRILANQDLESSE